MSLVHIEPAVFFNPLFRKSHEKHHSPRCTHRTCLPDPCSLRQTNRGEHASCCPCSWPRRPNWCYRKYRQYRQLGYGRKHWCYGRYGWRHSCHHACHPSFALICFGDVNFSHRHDLLAGVAHSSQQCIGMLAQARWVNPQIQAPAVQR